MEVADLLMSQRRWGRTRCRKFLSAIPLAENKTIGSMTERQRRALAASLPGERRRLARPPRPPTSSSGRSDRRPPRARTA